jgi:hypothetical protein
VFRLVAAKLKQNATSVVVPVVIAIAATSEQSKFVLNLEEITQEVTYANYECS